MNKDRLEQSHYYSRERRCNKCLRTVPFNWKRTPCKNGYRCKFRICGFAHKRDLTGGLMCRSCLIGYNSSSSSLPIYPSRYSYNQGAEPIPRSRPNNKRKRERFMNSNRSSSSIEGRRYVRPSSSTRSNNKRQRTDHNNYVQKRESFAIIGQDIIDLILTIRSCRNNNDETTLKSLLGMLFRKFRSAKSLKSSSNSSTNQENRIRIRNEMGITPNKFDIFIHKIIKAYQSMIIDSSEALDASDSANISDTILDSDGDCSTEEVTDVMNDMLDIICGNTSKKTEAKRPAAKKIATINNDDSTLEFVIDGDQFPKVKDNCIDILIGYANSIGHSKISVTLIKQIMEDDAMFLTHEYLIRQCDSNNISIYIIDSKKRITTAKMNRALSAGIPIDDVEPLKEVVDQSIIEYFFGIFPNNISKKYVILTSDSTLIATILSMSIAIIGNANNLSNLFCSKKPIPRWIKRLPEYNGRNFNEI
jgi:hypothetical protein